MKCPNCGGENDENAKICQYCNSEITLQMIRGQHNIKRCPQCGGINIHFQRENAGTVRNNTFTQVINKTVGFCSDCGYTWYPNGDNEPPRVVEPKKPNNENYMILWIVGWICFFPIPIMVLIWRKKNTWDVKIKILVTIMFWVIFLAIAMYGNATESSSTTNKKAEKVSTVHEDGILYEVPAGLTKKYEKAEYEKFNSYASENGLENTPIWIEGIMGDISSVDITNDEIKANGLLAIIIQDDGKEWLVFLDVEEMCDIRDYQDLKDHRVCICGRYTGFSDVYELPAMFMHRLFDETSGYLMSSQAYNKE